jgi:hypothetical protein
MVRAIDSGSTRSRRAGGEAAAVTRRARGVRDEAAATRPTPARRPAAATRPTPARRAAAAPGQRAWGGALFLFLAAIALPIAAGSGRYFDLRSVIRQANVGGAGSGYG